MQVWAEFLDKQKYTTRNECSTPLNCTQTKLKAQMANHQLSDPKERTREFPTAQALNNKWCSTRKGEKLVRCNELNYLDTKASLEKI